MVSQERTAQELAGHRLQSLRSIFLAQRIVVIMLTGDVKQIQHVVGRGRLQRREGGHASLPGARRQEPAPPPLKDVYSAVRNGVGRRAQRRGRDR